MTKILHVATFVFPDLFAGAERFLHGLARAQAAAGHDVSVLVGSRGGRPAEERLDGVRMVRYPLKPSRGLRFYRDVHREVTTSLRELAGEGFDILHAHQIASAAPALSASFPARKVLSFQASYQLEFEAERLDGEPSKGDGSLQITDRLKSWGIRILDRRMLGRAERIIVLSNFVQRQVVLLKPSAEARVRIIPPGIDFGRFAPGDRSTARERLGIPGDVHLIVAVRRLARRMGIDLLLRAARVLDSRGVRFVVAIGGVGPERDALEALRLELGLQDHVRFLGRVPDEELPELLRAADLVVVPSLSMEGFGLSTAEGLACGTPVLASDSGASPEILGPIDPALLVSLDPAAFAARIEELLADPERRRALSQKGLQSVWSRYDWRTIVSRIDEVYSELLGGRVRT